MLNDLRLPRHICSSTQYAQLVNVVSEVALVWLYTQQQPTSPLGGLRVLRLPMKTTLTDVETSNKYIDWITTCCPNIERLKDSCPWSHSDLGKHSYEAEFADSGEALWQLDLDVWTRFCGTCTRLTAFNWLCVPFATRCFEVFGQHMKPQLTKLTLGASTVWDWNRYKQQVGRQTLAALTTRGFDMTATNLHTVFNVCPQLRELAITLRDISYLRKTPEREVYHEGFWAALARCCPLMETLVVRMSTYMQCEPVVLTEGAMRVLATLRCLHSVFLEAAKVSCDGLIDFVANHSVETTRERVFEITACFDQDGKSLYSLLEGFLKRLVEYRGEELPCASRCVVVRFKSRYGDVDRASSVQYLKRLQQLTARIKSKFPSVYLKGTVRRYYDPHKSFDSGVQLTFATQRPSEEPRDAYDCVRIDDVFMGEKS